MPTTNSCLNYITLQLATIITCLIHVVYILGTWLVHVGYMHCMVHFGYDSAKVFPSNKSLNQSILNNNFYSILTCIHSLTRLSAGRTDIFSFRIHITVSGTVGLGLFKIS